LTGETAQTGEVVTGEFQAAGELQAEIELGQNVYYSKPTITQTQ